jgi:hypothetical protein
MRRPNSRQLMLIAVTTLEYATSRAASADTLLAAIDRSYGRWSAARSWTGCACARRSAG